MPAADIIGTLLMWLYKHIQQSLDTFCIHKCVGCSYRIRAFKNTDCLHLKVATQRFSEEEERELKHSAVCCE
jgi:hypothetical protein